MAEATFPCELDGRLESYVARLLDEAGIPNFVCFPGANRSFSGRYTAVAYLGWVVPDSHMDQAAKLLTEAKFPPCHGSKCTFYDKYSTFPVPDHHFHVAHDYPEIPELPDSAPPPRALGLYKKSRLFWTLPDPPIGAAPADDPYYMTPPAPLNLYKGGVDRGWGPLYPVKMPTLARYTEAMILLSARDIDGQQTFINWDVELEELFHPQPRVNIDDLNEPFREWAKRYADEEYAKQKGDLLADLCLLQMYFDLKKRNQLPPPEMEPVSGHRLEYMLKRLNIASDGSGLEPLR